MYGPGDTQTWGSFPIPDDPRYIECPGECSCSNPKPDMHDKIEWEGYTFYYCDTCGCWIEKEKIYNES